MTSAECLSSVACHVTPDALVQGHCALVTALQTGLMVLAPTCWYAFMASQCITGLLAAMVHCPPQSS